MALIFDGRIDTVSQFYDNGPYANHGAQATSGNQPTVMMGAFQGPAYNFDGSAQPNNDYFAIPADSSINNLAAISGVACLIRDTIGADVKILDKKAAGYGWYLLLTSGNVINFTVEHDGGTSAVAISTNTIAALVPQFIGFSWVAGEAPKLFLNGKECAYGTQTVGTGSQRDDSANALWVGSQNVVGTPMAFDGKLGVLKLWDTRRTILDYDKMYYNYLGISGLRWYPRA